MKKIKFLVEAVFLVFLGHKEVMDLFKPNE
jgi:hypothetical protein